MEKVAVDTSAVRYSVTGLRELVRDDVWDGPAVAEPAGVSGLTQGGGYQNVDSGRRHTMTGATPVPETLRPAGGRGVYSRPVYSPAPIPPRISREVEVSMYPTAGTSAGGVYTAPVYPNASAGPGRGEEEYFNPPPPYSGNRSTSMDSGVPVYPWAGGGAGSLAPPLQGLRHSASGRALQERYADGFRSRQRGQDPWDD